MSRSQWTRRLRARLAGPTPSCQDRCPIRLAVEAMEQRDVPSGFNFADFSSTTGLNLLGAAAVTGTNRLSLTPAQDVTGSAWYVADKMLVAGGFETTFRFQFTPPPNIDGLQGVAFLIQNSGPTERRGGPPGVGYDGVPNSVAVEFDTGFTADFNDPSESHISVHTNGTGPNRPHESYSLGVYNTPGFVLDDAQVHTAKVRYVPGTLSVYLDNLITPVLTVSLDLGATLQLDDGRAWLGFTAGNTGAPAAQDILDWSAQCTDDVILAEHQAVVEGAGSATTTANFTITRVGSLAGQAAVNWSTTDGTAMAGTDYVAASGQVVFADGESQKAVAVTVLGDDTPEPDESFKLLLSTAAGYSVASGLATIGNDDNVVSVEDATAAEGGDRIGRPLGAFVSKANNGGLDRARGLAWGPDGNLYVGSYYSHQILRFDGATGAFLGPFIEYVDTPAVQGLVFRPDGLYVLSRDTATVQRFDATTGAFLGVFIAPGSGGLTVPKGMTFGPDGNWYLSSHSNEILRYSSSGAFLGAFVSAGSGGLLTPRGLTFGPDGKLYVASENSNTVLRYNGQTGAFIDAFVTAGVGGLNKPAELLFHNGSMYVACQYTDEVLRYNAQTGAFLDKAVSSGLGGLDEPFGMLLDSNNNLVVGSATEVLRFGPLSMAAFTIRLDYASAGPVTVTYTTADGTATAGSDYTTTTGTVTFLPGQTTQTVLVPTVNNSADENPETFTLILTIASGATIADGTGVGTITDDDGTKFFVADDGSPDRTYRYGAPGNGLGNSALAAGNTAPRGAASTAAGDKVWVVDANKKVYVYDATGALLGSWSAGGLHAQAQVEGVTVWGSDLWLVDAKQDRVYRYAGAAGRTSGSQNATSNFALNSGNVSPKDLVTDGTSIWVVNDGTTDKVFKYTLSGTLQGTGWTMSGAGGSPTGITLDPTGASQDLWVVDNATDKVYQYAGGRSLTSGSATASATFVLAAGNTNPQGIADPPAADLSAEPAPVAPAGPVEGTRPVEPASATPAVGPVAELLSIEGLLPETPPTRRRR